MQHGATGELTQPKSHGSLLGWGLVFVVTVGIFVGTLVLKPKKHEA